MEITIVGSGDAFGSGGKMHTCFYINSGSYNFLIDCGASSLVALKKLAIDSNKINTIFISHFHGDHFGGLPFFILDAHLVQNRTSPLTIVGPSGIRERVILLMDALFNGSSGIPFNFSINYKEIPDDKTHLVNGMEVLYVPVVHSPESNPHGLKIKITDKSIAYSGDGEWTDNLIRLAENADLFITECYHYKGEFKFHMSYETLLNNRHKLNCKKLMLTHLGIR